MSAADSLKAAQAAGVDVTLDGEDLVLQASAPPPAAVLDGLSRYKSEIIVLLWPSTKDGQAGDERAGTVPSLVTAETETQGIPWADWEASNLNRLFQEHGLTGQPGGIKAETVRHGSNR